MKKKNNGFTFGLIILLVVKIILGGILITNTRSSIAQSCIYLLSIMYLFSLIGIIKKKRWSFFLAGGSLITELILMDVVSGEYGAILLIPMDLFLLIFTYDAYKEYKQLSSPSKKK